MTSFNLSYLPKALSVNVVTLGVGIQHVSFGGQGSVHSKLLAVEGASVSCYAL